MTTYNNIFQKGGIALAALVLLALPLSHVFAADLGTGDYSGGDYSYGDSGDYSGGDYSYAPVSTGDYSGGDYSYAPAGDYSGGDYSYDTSGNSSMPTFNGSGFSVPTFGGSSGFSMPTFGGASYPVFAPAPAGVSNINTNVNTNTCTGNSCNTSTILNAPTTVTVTNPNPQPVVYSQPVVYAQPVCTTCGCNGYNYNSGYTNGYNNANCYQPPVTYTQPCYNNYANNYNTTYNNCNPQPVAYNTTPYVTLTQVPYTGLDLGPWGEVAYWTFLVLWCLGAAYLIVVKRVQNKVVSFLNGFLFGGASHSVTTKVAHVVHTPAKAHAVAASAPLAEEGIDPFIASQIKRA